MKSTSTQIQNGMERHLRVPSSASTQIFAPEQVLHKERVQASIKKAQKLFVDAKPNVPYFSLTGEDRWVLPVFLNSQPWFPGASDNLSVCLGCVLWWSCPHLCGATRKQWPTGADPPEVFIPPLSHLGHVPSVGEKSCWKEGCSYRDLKARREDSQHMVPLQSRPGL